MDTYKSLRDTNSSKLIVLKTQTNIFNSPFNYIDWWFSYWAIVVLVIAATIDDAIGMPKLAKIVSAVCFLFQQVFVCLCPLFFVVARLFLFNSVDQTGSNFQINTCLFFFKLFWSAFLAVIVFCFAAIFRCCFYRMLSITGFSLINLLRFNMFTDDWFLFLLSALYGGWCCCYQLNNRTIN